jgi:hypothetical protein
LALVAGQDVEPGDGPGQWRIAQRTAPDRVISTLDPEARHTHKTQHSYRDGYKAHVAGEPDTGLVTGNDLTPGNTGDSEAAPGLLDGEPEGTEVLGDSAYGTGDLRAHLHDQKMTATIKPPSNPHPYDPPSLAATSSTTSPSTKPPGRLPARVGSRSLSPVLEQPVSAATAPTARSGTAALPRLTAGSSTSTPTTTCSPRPERTPPPPTSKPPTDNIDR